MMWGRMEAGEVTSSEKWHRRGDGAYKGKSYEVGKKIYPAQRETDRARSLLGSIQVAEGNAG